MYYVCIENNNITSILNYKPNVPSGVTLVQIEDEQYKQLGEGTHKFDLIALSVVPQDKNVLDAKELEKTNALRLEYLNSTDWMVLRHIRQKALGLETSLSEDKYIELEKTRQDAANSIV